MNDKHKNEKACLDSEDEVVDFNDFCLQNFATNKDNKVRGEISFAAKRSAMKNSQNLSTDNANLNHLKQRLRDVQTFSCLFLFSLFCAPIAIVSFYFGLKASAQLKANKQMEAEKTLRKAHFANLSAFISGSLICITYFAISIILLFDKTIKF